MPRPKVNKDFFNRWSSDMSYILGYIFADGCLVEHKNGYHGLDITSKDLGHLGLIKRKLNAEHKISSKERGYRIQIRNKNIYKELLRYRLTPRKSKNMKFPRVPRRYFSHFIRGYFDGDGSVMVWREQRWRRPWQIRVSFTSGCRLFLKTLRQRLHFAVSSLNGSISPVLRGHHLRYVSIPECLTLHKFMYKNRPGLYLKRKKDKFEKFILLKKLERS